MIICVCRHICKCVCVFVCVCECACKHICVCVCVCVCLYCHAAHSNPPTYYTSTQCKVSPSELHVLLSVSFPTAAVRTQEEVCHRVGHPAVPGTHQEQLCHDTQRETQGLGQRAKTVLSGELGIQQYMGLIKNNFAMIRSEKHRDSGRERKLFYQLIANHQESSQCSWSSTRLVIKRSGVQYLAGGAGELSCAELTFCADSH